MMRKLLLSMVFGLVSTIAFSQAQSHGLSSQEIQKVPDEILEQIKNGKEKNLLVEIDTSEIDKALDAKRKEKGLNFYDAELNEEMAAELKVLKDAIFPDGRLADAMVLHDYSHLPSIYVRVPNMKSLEMILRDPRVKRVFYIDPEKELVGKETFMYEANVNPDTFAFYTAISIGPIMRNIPRSADDHVFNWERNFAIRNRGELVKFNRSISERDKVSLNELGTYSYFFFAGKGCADNYELDGVDYEKGLLKVKFNHYFTQNIACVGDMRATYYVYRAEKSGPDSPLHTKSQASW